MVVIRLARSGAKKSPFYHIVVADRRFAAGSRYIEKIGYYNPMARGQALQISLDGDRLQHWVDQGAQMSQRVTTINATCKKAGTTQINAKAIQKRKPANEPVVIKAEAAAEEAPAEAPAEEAKAEKPAEETKAAPAEAKAEEASANKDEKPAADDAEKS